MPRVMRLSVFCTTLTALSLFIEWNPAVGYFLDMGCQQHPRFIATRKGSTVHFHCSCGRFCPLMAIQKVSWYQGTENSTVLQNLTHGNPSFHGKVFASNTSATITINKVQQKDNGIYFCRFSTREGHHQSTCGTELKVLGIRSLKSLKTKNTLKDAIIMIQTVLIVLFVSIPVLMIIDKNARSDPIEEDHTYEGLEIEQAPMYEDIVTLRAVESKWTAAEHPCLE
ncbi:B-cell antigen receptor complex-associated protein beta chain [Rhinatrema bivittatum]|uniref:B-cell antigen receptor complex-associated protein beta chain n=1 Tax=Rhinatrema bivittatum TaxID=194408 RepID=UPI00112BC4E5|nr:B-cell antigen receptor complex-associated protein beta chain [Rhinatrema bivittatum]XP_029429777.1 B-cell antigen receptor complex-associated protein beta chain [Rhinatrema bivittatum]